MKKNLNRGVTLVELAIVLVIIGLLITGVLSGEELIRQSEIRSDIDKFQSIRTASETFRLKYNYLPGDIKNATTYWPDCTSINGHSFVGSNVNCNGDGNGLFDNSEGFVAFYHLSRAGLLAGSYNPNDKTAWPVLKSTHQGLDLMLPITASPSPMGRPSTYFNIPANVNTFEVGMADFSSPDKQKVDANIIYSLDAKMDDGNGAKGSFRVYYSTALGNDLADTCTDSDGNYKLDQPGNLICLFALKY